MTRTRGKGVRHTEQRTAIADAALAVVDDHGIAGLSQTAVADRAGVSAGRVQHYFPTRDALVEAAFARSTESSRARITAAVGGDQSRAPALDVLAAVLSELVPGTPETRSHLRIRQSFLALALHDASIAERVRQAYLELHDRELAEVVRRGQSSGEIRVDLDPGSCATALVALAEGLAYYVLIGARTPQQVRHHLDAALTALTARR